MSDGTNSSLAIQRYLSGANDTGIASAVHVFNYTSAGTKSIALQHQSATGKTLTTFGANLIAVPLVTNNASVLNSNVSQLSGTAATSLQTYQDTPLLTTVTADYSGGGLMFAASFNSLTGTASAATGSWKLQYRESGGTWTDIGNITQRYMSGSNDTGSCTLYAMAEGVSAGSYEVKLVFKSDDGDSVVTTNGTLAAVALSFDENGGGYFPTLAATSDGGGNNTGLFQPIPETSDDIVVNGANGNIIAAMNFTGKSNNTSTATGQYDLELLADASHQKDTQENERMYASGGLDVGSCGAAGLFDGLAQRVYTVQGRHDDVTNNIDTYNVSVVGFSTGSIPEPMTAMLVVGGGVLIAMKRRRKNRA